MARVLFTADIHLGHKGVLDFDNRPWSTVEEMNEGLVERWNSKVGKGDHVYILGDLCWLTGKKAVELIRPLNGNLHLIRGNHDRIKSQEYQRLFASIKSYDTLNVKLENGEKRKLVLSHYPIPLYQGHYYGAIHLYGHVHNTSEEALTKQMQQNLLLQGIPCEMYNVWCGFFDWAPATIEEILDADYGTVRMESEYLSELGRGKLRDVESKGTEAEGKGIF